MTTSNRYDFLRIPLDREIIAALPDPPEYSGTRERTPTETDAVAYWSDLMDGKVDCGGDVSTREEK